MWWLVMANAVAGCSNLGFVSGHVLMCQNVYRLSIMHCHVPYLEMDTLRRSIWDCFGQGRLRKNLYATKVGHVLVGHGERGCLM
jgi:hypothetical protein